MRSSYSGLGPAPTVGMCPGRARQTGSWDGSVSGSRTRSSRAGTLLPFTSGLHAAPKTAPPCDLFPILLVPSFPLYLPRCGQPGPRCGAWPAHTLLALGSGSSQASSLIYDQLFALQMRKLAGELWGASYLHPENGVGEASSCKRP